MARDHPAAGPLRPHLPAAISRRQWLASAVLAVCTALVALALTAGPDPHQRAPQFLLVGVACSPIALLRRWPLTVLAAATVVKALVMTRGVASLPFAIVLGFASYCAASRLPRRVSITAAAASAAVLGGALLYATFAVRRISPAAEAIEAFLPLAAAWFIGDSIAARRRYLAGLAEQAERERAAEAELARQQVREERVRIARELHDVVAHTLAVITVQAGVGRRLMARRPEEASTALESIETIGRTAQEELRVVLGLLREEETGTAALAPAPGLVDVKELVETVRAAGTPVDLQLSGTDRRLSPAGLAILLPLAAVAFTALCLVTSYAGVPQPTSVNVGGISVPAHIDQAELQSWLLQHPQQAASALPLGSATGAAQIRSAIDQNIASLYQDYSANEIAGSNPAANEMAKIGLWLELEVGIGFMVGLGLGSLTGQRTLTTITLIGLEIIVTPILAGHVIPYFLDGQRLVGGLAMDQLRPAALAPGTGPGGGPGRVLFGGRGALGIPPMPTWAMISVIVGWIVGWSVIGAWRMITRDA